MEGAGSRVGRTSSRYGATTNVFTGPVRKWNKNWVPISSSSSNFNISTKQQNLKEESVTQLLLYKWTPLYISNNQPPLKKFKFIPIAVLEELKKENEERSDDEATPVDTDEDIEDGNNKENQDSKDNQMAPALQDLNELDLSLGFTLNEEDGQPERKMA